MLSLFYRSTWGLDLGVMVCRLIRCSPQFASSLKVSLEVLSRFDVSVPELFRVYGARFGGGVPALMVNIERVWNKK